MRIVWSIAVTIMIILFVLDAFIMKKETVIKEIPVDKIINKEVIKYRDTNTYILTDENVLSIKWKEKKYSIKYWKLKKIFNFISKEEQKKDLILYKIDDIKIGKVIKIKKIMDNKIIKIEKE